MKGSHHGHRSPETDNIVTVTEAAKQLEVSADLIYRLCRAGRLAHTRLGLGRGTIRIEHADVEALRTSGRVEVEEQGSRADHLRKPARRSPAPSVPDIIGQRLAAREARRRELASRRHGGDPTPC